MKQNNSPMNKILTIVLLFVSITLIAQYDYGLEIDNHDAKIDGKLNIVADTNSVFIGLESGINVLNESATRNTFIGTFAGKENTSGRDNTYIGYNTGSAAFTTGIGFNNVAIGNNAGRRIEDATFNVIIGTNAGTNYRSGTSNTIIGADSGRSIGLGNSSGSNNVFIGTASGANNTTGFSNNFIGRRSGEINSTGFYNTCIGDQSGKLLSTGYFNTLLGGDAGIAIDSGFLNTAIGLGALQNNSNGRYNTIIGSRAGQNNMEGSGNIYIGYLAGQNENTSNKLFIHNSNNSDPLIYGEFDSSFVKINGTLNIRDAFQLIPQIPPSGTCTENGKMLYGNDDELYLCKAGNWKQIVTN